MSMSVWLVAGVGLILFVALVALMARAQGKRVPSPDDADLPADVAALDDAAFHQRLQMEIASGGNIRAIKWVRARSGLGLKEAKDVVESLIPGALDHRVETVRGLGEADFQARLLVELAAGRRFEAIRFYRERTGLGLKEAKDAIEALEQGG